ncbi:hypothetical protein M0805_005338 [Coniferiporia weirii]|nr:hypothetical protein M0805_005338 [Coniferiporia weirii]
MPNGLTRHVSLSAGTWVLETLVKHYFEQLFKDSDRVVGTEASATNGTSGDLRRDELLYAEAFHIVKSFLDASTQHTVEELQQFSNTHTPSLPWMHVVRVLVPMACCDEAATYLIRALGGEEKTRQVVGGTKWWQVRGVRGVDAQWIVAKKDYHQALKRKKQQEQAEQLRKGASENVEEDEEAVYGPEMDELRCILHFHGGGYYFGSVDQERYCIQRLARKNGCRLLAINYRLSPQYPFPCAIQDALASYLYLIRPPPGSLHKPVNPAHIVVSGDSAGGGLTFALLQVLRDTGLPLPAGGVLISPWCDLTHSFPSIHTNTDTDVIPKYGLSIYKPSSLWPPPSEALTDKVQASLRTRIKQLAHQYSEESEKVSEANELQKSPSFWRRKFSIGNRDKHEGKSASKERGRSHLPEKHTLADDARTGDVRASAVAHSRSRSQAGDDGDEEDVKIGATAPLPVADQVSEQLLAVTTEAGEKLEVHDQVHMYAPNNLLAHPLVSPAFSYLGGLPPLYIIASDAEVLRDEIIYSAHKAAHPERYPVKPEAKELYPKLQGIEDRCAPTKVHLQVYDQTAHVLPVLFSFCTPAKFCFRAMASFTKYVTGSLPGSLTPDNDVANASLPAKLYTRRSLSVTVPRRMSMIRNTKRRSTYSPNSSQEHSPAATPTDESSVHTGGGSSRPSTSAHSDNPSAVQTEGPQYAGDPAVYLRTEAGPSSLPFVDNMIRERVSIRGELRVLEPESELAACRMPPERVGVVGELTLRRYIEGRSKWDEKFARTIKHISKRRVRNLDIARKETVRNVEQLQMHFFQDAHGEQVMAAEPVGVKEGLRRSAASWAWAWALDGAERPPPSSIVARRDTEEARRLSKIADQPTDGDDQRLSGNNLWSFLVNRLSLEKTEAQAEQRTADADSPPRQPLSPSAQASTHRSFFKAPRMRPSTSTGLGRRSISKFLSASGKSFRRDEREDAVDGEQTASELGVLGRVRSH